MCAFDQPVASSPLSFRDTIAASMNSGLSLLIILHGYNAIRCDRWRCGGCTPPLCAPRLCLHCGISISPRSPACAFPKCVSSYHSFTCPSSPTNTGSSLDCFSFHSATRSASTPNVSAAWIVFSKCCQINCWSYDAPFTIGPFSGE